MKKITLFYIVILICICFFCVLSGNISAQHKSKPELSHVEFNGNKYFSSSMLADVIVSKQTPNWFSKSLYTIYTKFGKKPTYFDSLLIRQDINSLNNFYKDNGFFESRVYSSYNCQETDQAASLSFSIDEGPHFIVRGHSILCPDSSLSAELYAALKEFRIDSAEAFSKALLQEKNTALLSYLRDNGYMLARVDVPVVNIDTLCDAVDITVKFYAGIRYIVDTLRVEKTGQGKEYVDEVLIKKVTGLNTDRYYSAVEKQKAQTRLYRTHLFSSVLISAALDDTINNYVPLVVNADVRPMQELSPEVIFTNIDNSFNLGLGANFSNKNFFGGARTLTLSGNMAVEDVFANGSFSNIYKIFNSSNDAVPGFIDVRASLEQPYLFNELTTGRLEAYWTKTNKDDYLSYSIGSKLSFDFELPKYVYLSSLRLYYSIDGSRYDFRKAYTEKLFGMLRKIDSTKDFRNEITFDKNWELTSIIGGDIGINKTDDLLFPKKGYNLQFTLEEANLIPEIFGSLGIGVKPKTQFYRITGTIAFFPNLYRSQLSAFGIKLKAGFLKAYAGEMNMVPINKRFTSGGSNSVRGWRARDLKPKIAVDAEMLMNSIKSNNNVADILLKGSPLGGTLLFEGSIETRNRLFSNFGMAAFVDYGNVFDGHKEFSFNKIAVAAGFGFRVYDYFAPIRVDIGFQLWDPSEQKTIFQRNQNTELWKMMALHLGIGEAF